jgi:hypothetical protein
MITGIDGLTILALITTLVCIWFIIAEEIAA